MNDASIMCYTLDVLVAAAGPKQESGGLELARGALLSQGIPVRAGSVSMSSSSSTSGTRVITAKLSDGATPTIACGEPTN